MPYSDCLTNLKSQISSHAFCLLLFCIVRSLCSGVTSNYLSCSWSIGYTWTLFALFSFGSDKWMKTFRSVAIRHEAFFFFIKLMFKRQWMSSDRCVILSVNRTIKYKKNSKQKMASTKLLILYDVTSVEHHILYHGKSSFWTTLLLLLIPIRVIRINVYRGRLFSNRSNNNDMKQRIVINFSCGLIF